MATIGPIAPSSLGIPPAIVFLPPPRTEAAGAGPAFAEQAREAASRTQERTAYRDPARPSRTSEDQVDGAKFRRRLVAVDPEATNRTERHVSANDGGVERRARARQPTNPFPAGPSLPFLAQSLAQETAGDGETVGDGTDNDQSYGHDAYRNAAAFAAELRVSFYGPGEPVRLAA